jgi:hypothetical protein
MSDEVHKIIIQTRAPRGKDPGKIAEGWYCVNADNFVVLTDMEGRPVGDAKRHLGPGGDARLISSRLLRQHQNARSSSGTFAGPIRYPKIGY